MAFERLFPAFRAERILHDRAGLLVVDKPPGVVVHGGDVQQASDLVSRLKSVLRARGESDYLGVHQRLDVGTSGALVFTRDPALNVAVAKQMEGHAAERAYVAVIASGPGKARLRDAGSLEHRLQTHNGQTRVVSSGGQRAFTSYRILDRAANRALIELYPETGRTHQLRVQLAHAGAPIVGDAQYGGVPAERLFLHARDLAFEQPVLLRCSAKVPESFASTLHARPPSLGSPERLRESLADAGCLRAPLLSVSDAFRVVNDLGDGMPGVCVDRYGDFAVLSLSSEEASARSQELAERLLELGARGVYLKQRARADLRRVAQAELAPKEPVTGQAAHGAVIVQEGNARFAVTLDEGLSCGLFLDQRDNRRKLAEFCGGRQVLNLFSYTCSFSVYAALAGAARVTSVDLSAHALARGRENFSLNGLDEAAHSFVQSDALEWLARAAKREQKFGVVVLDPPSFSTSSKGKTFRVADGYQQALALVFAMLEPGGRVLAVTNHRKTSPQAFRKMVHGAARAAVREIVQLKDLPSPLDCPAGPSGPFPAKSVLVTVK